MIGRAQIMGLVPHQGAMCLLDAVVSWSERRILCVARSHRDAANPLRRNGRLGTVCGLEYGLQAAALHGALSAGAAAAPGTLAALREVLLHAPFLDDGPELLEVEAELQHRDAAASLYRFRLGDAAAPLATGRGLIALPGAPA